jgi:hypothetical protein
VVLKTELLMVKSVMGLPSSSTTDCTAQHRDNPQRYQRLGSASSFDYPADLYCIQARDPQSLEHLGGPRHAPGQSELRGGRGRTSQRNRDTRGYEVYYSMYS